MVSFNVLCALLERRLDRISEGGWLAAEPVKSDSDAGVVALDVLSELLTKSLDPVGLARLAQVDRPTAGRLVPVVKERRAVCLDEICCWLDGATGRVVDFEGTDDTDALRLEIDTIAPGRAWRICFDSSASVRFGGFVRRVGPGFEVTLLHKLPSGMGHDTSIIVNVVEAVPILANLQAVLTQTRWGYLPGGSSPNARRGTRDPTYAFELRGVFSRSTQLNSTMGGVLKGSVRATDSITSDTRSMMTWLCDVRNFKGPISDFRLVVYGFEWNFCFRFGDVGAVRGLVHFQSNRCRAWACVRVGEMNLFKWMSTLENVDDLKLFFNGTDWTDPDSMDVSFMGNM